MIPVVVRAIVPEVVIGPPVRPAPVLIAVTVPAVSELIVTAPVAPEIEIPVPATMLVTPELVIVTLPVGPLTPMPVPARMLETAPEPPVEVMTPVDETDRPDPTIRGL